MPSAVVNGVELSWDEAGTGQPLLLLHGFMGSAGDWELALDVAALAKRWRVIRPDARMHGRSASGPTFSIRDCAGDVLGLMDALGVERFTAIGMSLGAKTLLHVATRARERVAAMVLVSAAPYFPEEARAIMAMSDAMHGPAELAALEAKHGGAERVTSLLRQGRAFGDGHDDLCFTPPLLSTIAARTLIVHGDRDPLYPVELALGLFRAIPDARLMVVPGGGHGPIFGPERPAFEHAVAAFL